MATNIYEQEFKQRTGEDFEKFYKNYNPRLIYYINNICNDEQLSEDLATQSFIQAFDKIETYDPAQSQFQTWLFTIGRNLALGTLKKNRLVMSMDVTYDSDGTTMKDFIKEEVCNTELLYNLNKEKNEIILKHITKLKEPFKTTIEMCDIKEISYKEISCFYGKNHEIEINITEDDIEDGFYLPFYVSKNFILLNENNESIQHEMIIGDPKKSPFFTHIKAEIGKYTFHCREPKNLSTIKSRIKGARRIIMENASEEIKLLEEKYL